jgi:hypothetical protein
VDYRDFLRSTLWRQTAARIRRRANNRCERCGEQDTPLTIHHEDYGVRNRTDAPYWVPEGWLPDDAFLQCLCIACHDFLHGRGADPMDIPSLAELFRMVRNWHPTN